MIYFRPSGPVSGDTFFGRTDEVHKLRQYVNNRQSVLILGERRIGKTSLLIHAYKHLNLLNNFPKVLYGGAPSSAADLAEYILDHLNIAIDQRSPLKQLEATLSDYSKAGRMLAIYINDVDDVLRGPEDGIEVLQRLLRSMIENNQSVTCATSFQNLDRLAAKSSTPPLFNVFTPLTLRGFKHDEAVDFLQTASERSGDILEVNECEFIITLVGLVPFNLQRFGFELFSRNGFVNSKGTERLNHFTECIDPYIEMQRTIWNDQLRFLSESHTTSLINAAYRNELKDNQYSTYLIERGFLDDGERLFATMGMLYAEFLRSVLSIPAKDSPNKMKTFFGELSRTAVNTAVDAAIKAYLR
jgi:hypothetical protein